MPLTLLSTIGSAESYGSNGRVMCTAAWTCWRAFSYSRLHKAAFPVNWYTGQSITPNWGMFCPNRPSKYCASFLVMGSARYNNLSVTLEGLYLHISHHLAPKNLTEVTGLCILAGFISYPLICICYQWVQSDCYLLFTWSNQHNTINIAHQCGI